MPRNYETDALHKANPMTAYTKQELERALYLAQKRLAQAKLAIGEVAGRENDWHDNAAFDQANMDHDLATIAVGTLAEKLRDVEIITARKKVDTIGVGNTVIVKFEGETEEETFTILGPDDTGRKDGWLSNRSPLGEHLIGKRKGQFSEFPLGDGSKQRVRVIKILPGDFE